MRRLGFHIAAVSVLVAHWFSWSSACAQETASPLTRWPQASVQRPLTLPESLGLWKAWSFYSSAQPWSWFPVQFENGITDDFTLVWLPIPIEARWRFFKTEFQAQPQGHQMTLTLNVLGAVTSQTQNFNWTPFLRMDYRWNPLSWLALDTALAWVTELRREINPVAGTVIAQIAPRLQPVDWLWVAVVGELWLEFGAPRAMYWGAAPASSATPQLRAPMGASLGLTLFNRLELENRLTVLALGYGSGFLQAQWSASATFWF